MNTAEKFQEIMHALRTPHTSTTSAGVVERVACEPYKYYCNGHSSVGMGCQKDIAESECIRFSVYSSIVWHVHCAETHGIMPGMKVRRAGTFYQVLQSSMTGRRNPCAFVTPSDRMADLRTQKSRGLAALEKGGFKVPPTVIIQEPRDMQYLKDLLHRISTVTPGEPTWVRPCPVTPRHGFVESRAASEPREVAQTWREARRADPQAELLIQPMVSAHMSAILTPNALTIGPGNDGATAGKDATLYTLGTSKLGIVPKKILSMGGITSKKDAPYIELVWSQDLDVPFFVQLRSGPNVKPALDYVPRKMKVKHIYALKAEEWTTPEALLEWERIVPTFPPGTVVVHPGGALYTHFGVHCVVNKVAYFTSRVPEVGETITRDTPDMPILGEVVRHAMLLGAAGAHENVWQVQGRDAYRSCLLNAMFALHNSAQLGNEVSYQMLGFAASTLFRMMSMACIGELRHAGGHGLSQQSEILGKWWDANEGLMANRSRQQVFESAWNLPHTELVQHMSVAAHAHLSLSWTTSIGGLNWGRCSLAALRLHEAILHVERRPSDRAVKHLIQTMNRCVNLVHNNGSLFNKFASQTHINAATRLNRHILLNNSSHALTYLHQQRSAPVPTLGIKPRVWRTTVSRDLTKYADSKNSIKRAYDMSGDIETFVQGRAINMAINAMRHAVHQAQTDAQASVLVAMWGSWARPEIPPLCTECGHPRCLPGLDYEYSPTAKVCRFDCDDLRSTQMTQTTYLTTLKRGLDKRIACSSIETCPEVYHADAHYDYIYHAGPNGEVVAGWKIVDPPKPVAV